MLDYDNINHAISMLFRCPECWEKYGQDSLLRDDCRCSWCLYRCTPNRIAGEEIAPEDVLADPKYAPVYVKTAPARPTRLDTQTEP